MDWRVGTMGFSYPSWRGGFYPRDLPDAKRLGFYSQLFDTIELDTTWYAIPPKDRVRSWADAVPEGFRFTVKCPRALTHESDLIGPAAMEVLGTFVHVCRGFGDKLAVVLLQFPPEMSSAIHDKLAELLEKLPRDVGWRWAVELRHDTWWTDRTFDLLRAGDIILVTADSPPAHLADQTPEQVDRLAAEQGRSPSSRKAADLYQPRPAVVISDVIYVRWLGRHAQFDDQAFERLDPSPRLAWWARRLQRLSHDHPHVRTAHGYFNNGYAGHSPATANRFKDLLGQPVVSPESLKPQMSLF